MTRPSTCWPSTCASTSQARAAGRPSRQFSRAMSEALRGGHGQARRRLQLVRRRRSRSRGRRPLAEAGVPFLESTETAMLALRQRARASAFPGAAPRRRGGRPIAVGAASERAAGRTGRARRTREAMCQLLRDFGIPLVETVRAQGRGAGRARGGSSRLPRRDQDRLAGHRAQDRRRRRPGRLPGRRRRCARRSPRCSTRFAGTRRQPGSTGCSCSAMVAGGTEMILGVKTDPLFGPAVVCGFGGIFVEVLRDVSVRVPPLDRDEARAMVEELRGAPSSAACAGRPPADVDGAGGRDRPAGAAGRDPPAVAAGPRHQPAPRARRRTRRRGGGLADRVRVTHGR